ncbi:MAG: trehalose-phosphatase [Minwuia sp.]|nr:trehalose-phosphatase [Minwuia sp.]
MIVGRQTALFLDYDGTLVDLAATPEAAQPPQGLVPLLQRLGAALDGAVAILSGRTVADIDRMLMPLQATVGGVHGAEIRMADGTLECLEVPGELVAIRTLCNALASETPALRIEDKGQAIAVHFRAVPAAEKRVGHALQAALATSRDLELIHGKMVYEVRRPGMHKGAVLQRLMQRVPFRDRVPLMIGDDRTDEDAFAMALQLGGSAIKVGDGETVATSRLDDPDAVRHLLAQAVETMKDAQ